MDLAAFCFANFEINEAESFLHLRFWISLGGKNFGMATTEQSTFYCVAYLMPVASQERLQWFNGVKEFTIGDIKPKIGILAEAKTTNYLINSLVYMASR